MDKTVEKCIDKVINDAYRFLEEQKSIHRLMNVDLTFFDMTPYKRDGIYYEDENRRPSSMYTVSLPIVGHIPGDLRIYEFESHIYMSNTQLYLLIIECRMNFEDVTECMKFRIKHEIGHIIETRKFIGKKMSEFQEAVNREAEDYDNFIKSQNLHKGKVSVKKQLEYYKNYHLTIPEEWLANCNVDIDEVEVLKDFNRRFPNTTGG